MYLIAQYRPDSIALQRKERCLLIHHPNAGEWDKPSSFLGRSFPDTRSCHVEAQQNWLQNGSRSREGLCPCMSGVRYVQQKRCPSTRRPQTPTARLSHTSFCRPLPFLTGRNLLVNNPTGTSGSKLSGDSFADLPRCKALEIEINQTGRKTSSSFRRPIGGL